MHTYVDLSTTGSIVAAEVAERLGSAGVDVLDAPVSGGVAGARARTLAVMAAGPAPVFERVRPQGRYRLSLDVLAAARELEPSVPTKSGLMVGLGETDAEIRDVLRDLLASGVSIVTLGQYLRPSRQHAPVDRYLRPEAFEALAADARAIGFPTVYAGVFVRSSYNAFEVFQSGGAH